LDQSHRSVMYHTIKIIRSVRTPQRVTRAQFLRLDERKHPYPMRALLTGRMLDSQCEQL
jgi:hypothetical protein